ncbi:DUF6341 family protein [Flavobacterium psychraquaticum]|uniref:DUF6341 family protein n=1 Tax=Flavobacterium psychraquaticum TaxID=3103958 RepID=UPI002ACDA697|nr:uracil phosphoribosyltransferase [Flavobacterium sp. LB-N7T]
MKSLFEGIGSLFTDFLLAPYDLLREIELTNWWIANILNWVFVIICIGAMVYWVKQLKMFNDNNEDTQDTTAHSFLK